MKKKLGILICAVLLVVASVGATIAWLTDDTQEVTNTFTVGDINILLNENGATDSEDDNDELVDNQSFEIIPGKNLTKAPIVTVEADSEKCFLFVKVTEENWPTAKVSYTIDTSIWTELTSAAGTNYKVYYRVVEASTAAQDFHVITADTVYVSDELTKAEMEAITEPKLAFKAYAVQYEMIEDAVAAWAAIPDSEK